MPILAVALICWIALGCLTIGYVAQLGQDRDANKSEWDFARVDLNVRFKQTLAQLNDVDNTATLAKDTARAAKQAAEGNAKTLQDHLDWVWAERAKREKAALQPSKPRRRAHMDRDR